MKKNFNKELWYTLKKYNYHVASIVEFYIVRVDNLGERTVIKCDMNSFKEELLKFNNSYHPDIQQDKKIKNFYYSGWVTFNNNLLLKENEFIKLL